VIQPVGSPKGIRVVPVILTDPAISEKSSAARSAVVCAGLDEMERVIVLEAWAERCQPLKMIDKIFEMSERWNPICVTVEGVAYQRALKGFIEMECIRRGTWLNVREVRPGSKEGKESRIRGLQPYAQRGRLWIRRSTSQVVAEEFEEFPLGDTVDVLDALSYGPQVWVTPDTYVPQGRDPRDLERPPVFEGVSRVTGY
jgi:hypothetical protein